MMMMMMMMVVVMMMMVVVMMMMVVVVIGGDGDDGDDGDDDVLHAVDDLEDVENGDVQQDDVEEDAARLYGNYQKMDRRRSHPSNGCTFTALSERRSTMLSKALSAFVSTAVLTLLFRASPDIGIYGIYHREIHKFPQPHSVGA